MRPLLRRIGNFNYSQILSRSLEMLGPQRALLIPVVLLSILVSVLEATVLYLIARLAVALSAGDRSLDIGIGPLVATDVDAGVLTLSAAVLVVVLGALSLPLSRRTARLSAVCLIRLRTRVARAFLRASWSFRAGVAEGHLQTALAEQCARSEVIVQQMSTLVVSTFGIAVLAVAALSVAPVAGSVTLLGLAVLGAALAPFTRRLNLRARRQVSVQKGFGRLVAEVSRTAMEVAAFRVEHEVGRRLDREIRATADAVRRVRTISRLTPMMFQYAALGIIVALIGVLTLVSVDLAGVAPVLLILLRSLAYVRQFHAAIQSGAEVLPYLSAVEEITGGLLRHETRSGTRVVDRIERVAVESVSYEYVPGTPVLRDVSFEIRRGEALGVVGPSGGGKSTLSQLLLHLREPTSGRIVVDGIPLSEVLDTCWAGLVGFVPQDNQLLAGTVTENVLFYRTGHSGEEVRAAVEAAHLHEEVMRLPERYDTVIGPGARNLSGGQRQRLGIARALLTRPRMLVLDEPTSALDHRSEHMIRDTLQSLKGDTALVIVAHRPATLDICDRVLRVDRGTVTEQPHPGPVVTIPDPAVPGTVGP